jgi:ubiquinone/menaquinone biosynthesis C-methylase UbiE
MEPTIYHPARTPSPLTAQYGISAPRYDLSYRDAFWTSRSYEDGCDRVALRALLPASGGHLVDLGAGFGRLANEFHGFDAVTLVDASPTMVHAAQEKVGADPRFHLVLADAAHLPLADQSVDAVVAVRLLVHVPVPTAMFREVARVLRPGGRLIIEYPNRRHLLAAVRYLTLRQSWSPANRDPFEYLPGHYAHHPSTISAELRAAGLVLEARRSVSLFRSAYLKRHVPAPALVALESALQAPLGRVVPGPSIFVRAIRAVPATIDHA